MAACDVAAMQRSGLRLVLAAALAALILSACTPRAAEALRLACTDRSCGANARAAEALRLACTDRSCGANARCLKSVAGWADCVCDRGFKLLPNASCARECLTLEISQKVLRVRQDRGFKLLPNASCAQVCTSADCGENGYCEEEQEGGRTTCRCNTGFTKTADGCVDTCVLLECGENGQCVKDEEGVASCVCDAGFTLRDDGKSCAGLHPSSCHLLPATAAAHGAKRRTPRATALVGASAVGTCARDCGENAYCEKEQELAVCHCNWGYAMTDTGCVDTCILQACGENGRCVKDEAGMASCVCDVGFTLMGDGRTCTDNCILKRCQALTSDCMKYEDGTAYCVCKPGYTLLYGTCVGPATCGNCPSLATCTLVSSTRKAPYCVCPAGFGMTATGCVRGALPTVSSASLTFYNQPGLTLTPSTYTLRVRYSRCTNLPSTIGLNVRSYWRVDRAPGGAGHCQFVNAYRFANCVTQVAQLPALSLSGIAAASVS
ncbi:unnamed protein product [Closterium sp. NIES-65]|nr:unnamed protein product [Closterium sp. NIES-65]